MTFDEAMHAECARCGQAAQSHRMTNSGQFYCLMLKPEGLSILNQDIRQYGYEPGVRDAMRLPVRYLYKARFREGVAMVSTIIKDGLKNYVGQPA